MNIIDYIHKSKIGTCVSPMSLSTSTLLHLYKSRNRDPYILKILQDKHCIDLEIDICREDSYMHKNNPILTLTMEYDDTSSSFTNNRVINTEYIHYKINIYKKSVTNGDRDHIVEYDMMRMSQNLSSDTLYEVIPPDFDTNIIHTDNMLKWVPSEREVESIFHKKSPFETIISSVSLPHIPYIPYAPYLIVLGIISSMFVMGILCVLNELVIN